MKLHNYFRSSASFRVRIALNIKGLPFDYLPVHLPKGEQKSEAFSAIAPERLVPVLETDEGLRLSQSLAIIEYLDETCPTPALLPADAFGRAQVRALALLISCDIHPLNNLRVLKYLVRTMKVSDEDKNAWYRHWVEDGLAAFERLLHANEQQRQSLALPPSHYCWGDTPTLADCCLVPQIFNGQRMDCDFTGLPRTMAVFDACMRLPAFQKAQPSACPDNEA